MVLTQRFARAMAQSMQARIQACALDLRGATVATECANGAYAATAAAAVATGARVFAFARDSRYATADQAAADVMSLVGALGCDPSNLHIVRDRDHIPWSAVDLVTNSGHLRPLDAALINELPAHAVIALMFEPWELRDGDIDIDAARRRGIAVLGVDEHHPACGAFEFVGLLAVSEVLREPWSLHGARGAVLGDAAFVAPVARALHNMNATAIAIVPDSGLHGGDVPPCPVVTASQLAQAAVAPCELAIVCATPPSVLLATGRSGWSVGGLSAAVAQTGCYGAIQLWGDLDREQLADLGVSVRPSRPPAPGHQGVAMSAAGPEPVIRLQIAGLAAAWHGRTQAQPPPELAGLAWPVGQARRGI